MDPRLIVPISIGGVFLLAGLILIGIFVIFVAFPKLTVKVTANQTWSKRYKNVPIGKHKVRYVDMTKCHYVYKASKKEYRFKMEFYKKTQRQSPLRLQVRYIKAIPRIFCVYEPSSLDAGIYLLLGILCIFMAGVFFLAGFFGDVKLLNHWLASIDILLSL